MSVLDQSYEVNSPAVISDEVGGEVLAIHLDTGTYFVFPPASLQVWEAICDGVPPRMLLTGADDSRAQALITYVERLSELQLIRVSQTLRLLEERPSWSADDLEVQRYTDLADLLGPDPIHDVDEQVGWPTIKESDR